MNTPIPPSGWLVGSRVGGIRRRYRKRPTRRRKHSQAPARRRVVDSLPMNRYRTTLAYRDFRLLWTGMTLSALGDSMSLVALLADNLIRGAAFAIVPLLYHAGALALWHLYAVAALFALLKMLPLTGRDDPATGLAQRAGQRQRAGVDRLWRGDAGRSGGGRHPAHPG